jgi:hypothetical protein
MLFFHILLLTNEKVFPSPFSLSLCFRFVTFLGVVLGRRPVARRCYDARFCGTPFRSRMNFSFIGRDKLLFISSLVAAYYYVNAGKLIIAAEFYFAVFLWHNLDSKKEIGAQTLFAPQVAIVTVFVIYLANERTFMYQIFQSGSNSGYTMLDRRGASNTNKSSSAAPRWASSTL